MYISLADIDAARAAPEGANSTIFKIAYIFIYINTDIRFSRAIENGTADVHMEKYRNISWRRR
jgi:hypothetical protein